MEWKALNSLPFPLLLAFTVYAVASGAAFVAYAWDKAQASRNSPRVREGTLHFLALIGGWPGALVAGRLFRHKTSKLSFRLVTLAIVLLHLLGWFVAWRAGWLRLEPS